MKSSSTSATKVICDLIAADYPLVREGLVTILKDWIWSLIGPNETFGSAVFRIDKHDVLRIAAWCVD